MARRSRKKKQPAVSLTDDLLVEILARVPYRSLCRFKCVSQSWHALCSDPDLRKMSPQTLSGFFCHARMERDGRDSRVRFVNLSGKGRPLVDPDLLFLHDFLAIGLQLVDCCSSLLLCKCFKNYVDADWVVCNPATEKWTVMPATEALHCSNSFTIRLGFDPAIPTRFEAFVLKQDSLFNGRITGVEIYSSETGQWISMKSEWGSETCVDDNDSQFVFFNDTLHFTTFHSARDDFCMEDSRCECDYSLVTVDTEGKTWRKFPLPYRDTSFCSIGQSQGRLYAMHIDHGKNQCILSVWLLEDYATGQWILMHTANVPQLFGRHCRDRGEFCSLIAIHPECNVIFLIDGVTRMLVSYNMDNRKVHAICSIGEYCPLPFRPYIPCFAEWLSDGK
ncbi:F-box protein At5g07610-like [Lolium rigidum]|uniref:F-box protein At5g07610-like n=1 Tax=Lolium rigidum TaxID=89674 RepID=UPI001F5D4BCE|nr:F-box protein At5g07610-like [Lolium rigidum]